MADNKDKEKKIAELRETISYLTEKLKVTYSSIEKADINDQILNAKKEIGKLESKALDRIKRVDIIDAPPVADRLELESHRSRSGVSIKSNNTRNRVNLKF